MSTTFVSVRPSTSLITNYRLSLDEQYSDWPLHRRNCQVYGFGIHIVKELTRRKTGTLGHVDWNDFKTDFISTDGRGANLILRKEKLIIRVPNETNQVATLKNSDEIHSFNGEVNPTFATLYRAMCQGDELHMELKRPDMKSEDYCNRLMEDERESERPMKWRDIVRLNSTSMSNSLPQEIAGKMGVTESEMLMATDKLDVTVVNSATNVHIRNTPESESNALLEVEPPPSLTSDQSGEATSETVDLTGNSSQSSSSSSSCSSSTSTSSSGSSGLFSDSDDSKHIDHDGAKKVRRRINLDDSTNRSFLSELAPPSLIMKMPAPPDKPPPILQRSSDATSSSEPPNELKRLWPDPSDIIKTLTHWNPPNPVYRKNSSNEVVVQFSGSVNVRPLRKESDSVDQDNPFLRPSNNSTTHTTSFKNANEILEAYAFSITNEGLCSINADYNSEKNSDGRWSRPTYDMKLRKLTLVSPIYESKSYFFQQMCMYEMQFSPMHDNRPPSRLCELYAIYYPPWKTAKFGLVAHDFLTTVSFNRNNQHLDATLKIWICVVEDEKHALDTGWVSREQFQMLLNPHMKDLHVKDDASMTLLSVGSMNNIVRQFEAIKSLQFLKPHLQEAIFSSRVKSASRLKSSCDPNSTLIPRPASLPLDIWEGLKERNNIFQLESISNLVSGRCLKNLSLIQGPPGTGKSSTIVGLVSALLSGKAPLPGKKQSGCKVHAGKTLGVSLQSQVRILICAASNQAVDSLAWKIKNISVGTSGKVGDFTMARYGSLPLESYSTVRGEKTTKMSEMEKFLYDINVDVKAGEGQEYCVDNDYGEDWRGSTPPEGMQPKKRKRKSFKSKSRSRSDILSSANVVLSTLSGAGSKSFIEGVSKQHNKTNSEFCAVIIDEACQASEPESLIPFKFNPTTVTLVGDPQQLPVLSRSGSSYNNNIFERSLFERLKNQNWPTILLREQYRMHESISAFPSEEFYEGKLITSDFVTKRTAAAWESHPCFGTLVFWDTKRTTMGRKGTGFVNNEEVKFIIGNLLRSFSRRYYSLDTEVTVGIISFYKDQVQLLQDELSKVQEQLAKSNLNIKVATVDGFQGSECDIIIVSCVRSCGDNGGVGFLNNHRRVNVALTRAKISLWIVGNSQELRSSPLWKKLLHHLNVQKRIRTTESFCDDLLKESSHVP